jgi:ubiquinone/menaquinone biosynthesis C-methylase UbiE
MDRKVFIRDIYSNYWLSAREKRYGFSKYDKNLSNYICENVPNRSKILEVAIGTGYPFADFFQKEGYFVYGIDISPDLINKCQQLNPEIHCRVGDAEELDYPDSDFDCTYCFHSSWYFPNLNKAIDEMFRVTRPNGLVIFDIQNLNNHKINKIYRRNLFENRGIGRIIRIMKNIAIIILNRGCLNWHFVDYEVPSSPRSIYNHFLNKRISNICIMVKRNDGSIEIKDDITKNFNEFGRLIFVIRK